VADDFPNVGAGTQNRDVPLIIANLVPLLVHKGKVPVDLVKALDGAIEKLPLESAWKGHFAVIEDRAYEGSGELVEDGVQIIHGYRSVGARTQRLTSPS
jgi:hypothetical protein